MNDWLPRGDALPHCRYPIDGKEGRFGRLGRCRIAVALLALVGALCAAPGARAQSLPTASRLGDLQLGGGFVFATSNYNFTPIHLVGGSLYTTFDNRTHWGGEFNFRQIRSSADSNTYERTFEIGPRFFLHRGPFVPYAKALYGRGIYNFSSNGITVANIAYNMYTFGGGVDVQVRRSINVRGDYEYQSWAGFPLGTLHPNVVTIGVAYHFHE